MSISRCGYSDTTMKKLILSILVFLILSISLAGTQAVLLQPSETKSVSDGNALNNNHNQIPLSETMHHYRICTIAYSKDKLGLTLDVSGYRIYFYHQEFANGTDYIDFYDIQFADAAATEEDLDWYRIPGLDRLEIYVPPHFDLFNVTEALDAFPHDSMEAYYVYTTLIDVLAFDSHKNVFRYNLFGANTTCYVTPIMESRMPDWAPLITDINALVAETYYTYIAGMNDVAKDQIFFYKNDDTLINQTMHLDEFPFPMVVEGTTRFFGHITVNNENTITHGTLTEYFLGKVTLFKIIPVYSFIRREQTMELLE